MLFRSHIAGTGEEKYIEALRKISPLANFYGFLDKWEFLKEVKVLIVPSIWEEPAGRIVREGIWAGCSLAISKYGGLQEMGEIPEVNIFVFDPLSEPSIAKIFKISKKYDTQLNSSKLEMNLRKKSNVLLDEIQKLLKNE